MTTSGPAWCLKSLAELKYIRPIDIGNRYRHQRQMTTWPSGGYFEVALLPDSVSVVVKELIGDDREVPDAMVT